MKLVHCQHSDQSCSDRILPGVIVLVYLGQDKETEEKQSSETVTGSKKVLLQSGCLTVNTEYVSLTMTCRCSSGVVSLSLTPRISLTSPVSLSIRKRPSSSPSMNTTRVTDIHMYADFKYELALVCVWYLREWHSWVESWVLCLHPLHEWDQERSPTPRPATWHTFMGLNAWLKILNENTTTTYLMVESVLSLAGWRQWLFYEHHKCTILFNIVICVWCDWGKVKQLTSSPSVTLTVYTGLVQMWLVSSWKSSLQGRNSGYWSSPSWTMMVNVVLVLKCSAVSISWAKSTVLTLEGL